jgi:hypothetical protein
MASPPLCTKGNVILAPDTKTNLLNVRGCVVCPAPPGLLHDQTSASNRVTALVSRVPKCYLARTAAVRLRARAVS